MLTLVGEDQAGIVAKVTDCLYRSGWNLGETSMIRLGGNFTVMMMVAGHGNIQKILGPVARELDLHMHVDDIRGSLHQHLVPNIQVRVNGADRAGIIAQVTAALAGVGFNILELESDVAGTTEAPVYIMNIQGYTDTTLERVEQALSGLGGIDASVSAIETLIG